MRRKVIVLLAVGFAALSGSLAENHAEMQPPRDVSQGLQNLEHRWVEALVKADTRKLDDILGNRFVDTDEEGNRTDKRGVLGALESGDLKMASIILSGMQVPHLWGRGGRDRWSIANRHIQGSTPGASHRIHRHLCPRERELESGCVPPIRRAQSMRVQPLVGPRTPKRFGECCSGMGSAEQPSEILCGYDPRGFLTAEGQQPALVTRHQIIGLARFGQG